MLLHKLSHIIPVFVLALTIGNQSVSAQITLEQCQEMAQAHYPLLQNYELIRLSSDFSVSNAAKGYLPQLTASIQDTYQSGIMSLPDPLKNLMSANGLQAKGVSKNQYRFAIDLNQIIYDGGNINATKEIIKAENEARIRQLDVDMYELRGRINDIYFGILLLDEQISLNEALRQVLSDNCRKITAMAENGLATGSDVDAMQAEYVSACQQHINLTSNREAYCNMLSIFIGQPINEPLVKPSDEMPANDVVNRPELSLLDAHINSINARRHKLDTALRPSISLFASGYYGYSGYDMFKDVFSRKPTLNGLIGVRVNWNIGSLYTRRNDIAKINLEIDQLQTKRDTFLFNNNIITTNDNAAIDRYRELIKSDNEIIRLRTSVRRSAEAKLDHGIIDVNNLLQEITRENQAHIQQAIHEIELLKSIHQLRNNLNQ